ncbi:hypothetical protein EVAR_38764_1 [Eumeta japonica]|uniref:Uncharacterized protein n=1 Tax=Eumeta variegata TaxID=151549 RepID=A0A4C1WKJ2_EUMVA|nr:hypothetical protein EVAR_38764_1 [Eumeta japonica]
MDIHKKSTIHNQTHGLPSVGAVIGSQFKRHISEVASADTMYKSAGNYSRLRARASHPTCGAESRLADYSWTAHILLEEVVSLRNDGGVAKAPAGVGRRSSSEGHISMIIYHCILLLS